MQLSFRLVACLTVLVSPLIAQGGHTYPLCGGAEQNVPDSKECPSAAMYTLNVDEVRRGKLPRTIRVFSENSRCHYFPMVVGKTYILFVSHARGRTIVDDCGNSGSYLTTPETLTAVRQLMQEGRRKGPWS